MSALLILSGAIAGALVGSFIATLCLRWPRGVQAMVGRSRCDDCGTVLGARELVPVLSAALAGGRCRSCAATIDPFHRQVEVAAAAAGAAAMALSPGAAGAALALLLWLMLPIALLDARHLWIPDRLSATLALAGLAAGGLVSGLPLGDRLIGGAAGFAALALLALAYRRIRGRDGLGAGDAKLLGAIGLWTGWQALPPILLLASLAGLAAALATGRGRLERIAFGTLLCLGAAAWSAFAVAGAGWTGSGIGLP